MTIQQAYIKGLDDAEDNVVRIFVQILRGEEPDSFPNPTLQGLADVLRERSDYYSGLAKRNNNIGKVFRKREALQLEAIDNLLK